ncbi:HD superfamily phosphodiesterase [Inquilinus ginsengisoli]|uniref:hypothetical protein n=1 Tax=Inquilinus ginsengisoli TaxID=363840 RepID=UPI003D1A2DE9
MTHQDHPTDRISLLRIAIGRAEAEMEGLRSQAADEIVTELETGQRSTRLLDIRHRRMVLQDDLNGLREALDLLGARSPSISTGKSAP